MPADLSELKEIFNNVPENPNLKSNNLFSIGTRGFYENPFTEVLSYLLRKNTEYKRRDEMMKILLGDLDDDGFLDSLILNCEVSTQSITSNGKYIDLILYNDTHVLVFENKINHWMANPFGDYEDDIQLKFPLHNKKYVILSYKKETCPENWNYLSIRACFDKIIGAGLHAFDNKWDYFAHDFLVQFSNTRLINMDQSYLDFYEKNFSQIISAHAQLKIFFIDIAEKVREKIEIHRYHYSEDWSPDEHAIRFYPFNNDINVTLIFKSNGTFSVSVYYYDRFHLKNEIHEYIGFSDYRYWSESAICCYTKLPGKEFTGLEHAVEETLLQLKKQKEYYA